MFSSVLLTDASSSQADNADFATAAPTVKAQFCFLYVQKLIRLFQTRVLHFGLD